MAEAKKITKKKAVKRPGESPSSPRRAPAKTTAKKEVAAVVLRLRVRAYDSKILDASVKQIIDTARRHDAEIVGPVPLPTEIKKYTVNRASFVYKNA
ncbi:MAG TPA: 30S ribosomal protein S10, partial [Candidatus Paceibacterota bacterium]|nr:30S ribosomal protein S10 [Candidatus Paceibacterota bacterium]